MLWLKAFILELLLGLFGLGMKKKKQEYSEQTAPTMKQKSVQSAAEQWYKNKAKLVLLSLLLVVPGCALSFTDTEKTHFVPNEAPVQLAEDTKMLVWCEREENGKVVERWKAYKKVAAGAYIVYITEDGSVATKSK